MLSYHLLSMSNGMFFSTYIFHSLKELLNSERLSNFVREAFAYLYWHFHKQDKNIFDL